MQYRVNLVNIAKDLKKNGYPLSDYRIEIPENEKFNAHECAINNEPSIVTGKQIGRAHV